MEFHSLRAKNIKNHDHLLPQTVKPQNSVFAYQVAVMYNTAPYSSPDTIFSNDWMSE